MLDGARVGNPGRERMECVCKGKGNKGVYMKGRKVGRERKKEMENKGLYVKEERVDGGKESWKGEKGKREFMKG